MRDSVPLLLFAVVLPGAFSLGFTARMVSDPPEVVLTPPLERPRPIEVRVTEVVPAAVPWEDRVCRVSQEWTRSLSADASDRLRVRAGTGALEVRGVEAGREVRVQARLCASDVERLLQMEVGLRRVMGPDLVVETVQPDPDGALGWSDDDYARIDLVLEVPAGIRTTVEDGSGPLVVSDVGDLRLRDGAGEIDVSSIRGDVHLDDGSGAVRVRGVRGDVVVDGGSGALEVRDVQGGLVVSGSQGEVGVSGVAGGVRVPDGVEVRRLAPDGPEADGRGGDGGA